MLSKEDALVWTVTIALDYRYPRFQKQTLSEDHKAINRWVHAASWKNAIGGRRRRRSRRAKGTHFSTQNVWAVAVVTGILLPVLLRLANAPFHQISIEAFILTMCIQDNSFTYTHD
jgi:hypothetical protein